ncbi:MAG TPA: PqqD family protein [Candidatus Eremiobacteraeota bacterium]|nr:MAG: Coenzyme PQQ synthesis protein D [bacterium ADurb.Bin363]HPZ10120.1 PqqD family protein [Candidatus Eremiobacteraeota bacterium]
MLFNPGLSKENILNFKPVKSGYVNCVKKKGKFFLEISRDTVIDRFCQKFFKVPGKSTLELDDIGKKVWTLCDGKRTLEEVASSLQEEFGSRIEPAIPRLVTFMKMLYQNRLITWER